MLSVVNEVAAKIFPVRKKKILIVAFHNSIHTTRYINQLPSDLYEIYLAPVYNALPHPELDNDITIYYPEISLRSIVGKFMRREISLRLIVGKFIRREISFKSLSRIRVKYLSKSLSIKSKQEEVRFGETDSYICEPFGPEFLNRLIAKIKPDIIHSMEFQKCGYNVLHAKKEFQGKFPKWLATNWGSDIYYFKNFPEHKALIKEMLQNIDAYSCECHRDVELANSLGYKGPVLPVIPNAGGIDLKLAANLRTKQQTSKRKVIAIKGYQSFAGRALTALEAIVMCKDILEGYEIVVYSASPEVRKKIQSIKKQHNLNIKYIEQIPHSKMLELFASARIYFSISASDGASTSFLEALTMGAFPVQTNTSCCQEWVEDQITGMIVPVDDVSVIAAALRRAIEDDGLVDKAADLNWKMACKRLDLEESREVISQTYQLLDDNEVSRGILNYGT